MRSNEAELKEDVAALLPKEVTCTERKKLLDELINATLDSIDLAIKYDSQTSNEDSGSGEEGDEASPEAQEELGDEAPGRDPGENLLDRLLYKAVLPRYAFPTDVAAFYVFDQVRSTRYRASFRYTPSQGLATALSQYAPGKEVWIDSKL